ncbi:putative radical SAM family enzyme, NOT coproporphyrinogen III oxidase, oxygen-independent [Fulvivirga imtechensis AK7]|uniref:Heme chaperone HemW n=1 Tax=Fulvivirga imtechensis AK7 TaxID=1237149 RepID=L8JRA8_9BACT|nr:putative radical SAM family enzyme, NOT coproporphyrinogen III oxidase, oxygen-independent [Fulvivirga imtechensis AK7]
MNEMTDALCTELKLQKDYLENEMIGSIYFGGGTPSLLNKKQLVQLLASVKMFYNVSEESEITLEANPDDLNSEKLDMLFNAGVNRLSIGIQSFNQETLKFLNRAHTSNQAVECIAAARKAGFSNISIDLIYAILYGDHQLWKADLAMALEIAPEHISSYCLTIEPKTVFGNWLKKGSIPAVEEEYAAQQFEILIETLTNAGYEQYEVSNFSKPGYHSRHNSSYWKQEKYLGVGPSAHSYNGDVRQFNVNNNGKYLKALSQEEVPFEVDELGTAEKINEYLLTTLRTKWGANLEKLISEWNYDLNSIQRNYLNQLFEKKYAIIEDGHLKLTSSGLLLADRISSDLFKD